MTPLRTLFLITAALGPSLPAMALAPPVFQGKPDIDATSDAGAFVWRDDDGLHVRFRTKGDSHRLHGKVCTPDRVIEEYSPVRTDRGDQLHKGPKGHCVHFDFHTAGQVDGFDLRAPGDVVKFDFWMGDQKLSTEHIFVGAENTHPRGNPFYLDRPTLTPPAFQGKPDIEATSGAGAFVWHDDDGLHVRFSTKGDFRRLHGEVCTPDRVVEFSPVRTDYGDLLQRGPQGQCVLFDFHTAGQVDGFDIRAPGDVVRFDFRMDDQKLSTEHIFVGAENTHPSRTPFFLDRR